MIYQKKRPGCLEFTGLVTTICVLSLPETVHMVFRKRPLAGRCLQVQQKCLDGNWGPQNSVTTRFPKKRPVCLEFIGLVTTIWVLLLSKIMKMVFTESCFSQISIFKVNKNDWMTTGGRKSRKHGPPLNVPVSFEKHWTSDTPESTVALSDLAFGLCRTLIATHCL